MNSECLGDSIQRGRELSKSISALHEDIIQTHIFTRLDGAALASVGCASSQLHALSTGDKLWQQICNETWPSTADPTISCVISTMPAGHRSFYYDAFPNLHRRCSTRIGQSAHKLTRTLELSKENPCLKHPPQTSTLISAVDIHYQNKIVLSKIHETETGTGWFLSSPFRVDLLDPKETISNTPAKFHGCEKTLESELENNLALSWILIDPARKQAANFSSLRPVSVTRHWITADVQVRYATILLDSFLCTVVVTCGADVLQPKEVSFHVEDMEGRNLSGRESLEILEEVMESGQRRKKGGNERRDEREMYMDFVRMKEEMSERKQRRERRVDFVFIATVVTIFVAWVVILLKRYS
ncbi:hypothetical protein Vadar_024067 [Vaccinium darrowii]|uniref:Uncharacterized protein n=1 Tax=Vaccinium darrowii TaxID=229202 RepID=A0ACB7XC96_9ERIC|nr:hypothetical protein Vadar_024067 [Vaccinium darrowii]